MKNQILTTYQLTMLYQCNFRKRERCSVPENGQITARNYGVNNTLTVD